MDTNGPAMWPADMFLADAEKRLPVGAGRPSLLTLVEPRIRACLELQEMIERHHSEVSKKLDEMLGSKEHCSDEMTQMIDLDMIGIPSQDPPVAHEQAESSSYARIGCHDGACRSIIDVDEQQTQPNKLDQLHESLPVFKPSRSSNSVPIMRRSALLHWQSLTFVQRVVRSTMYEVCVMALIIANAVFIGWQLEALALAKGSPNEQSKLSHAQIIFMVFFIAEISFRILGDFRNFFSCQDRYWNYFDLFTVLALIAEPILGWIGTMTTGGFASDFSFLRLFRIARVARLVNLIRLVRFFRELRLMLHSILGSFKPLLWVIIVWLMFLYVFGIVLMGGALEYLAKEDAWEHESTELLREKFGSVPASMLSLFEAIAGGISWTELVAVLEPLHPVYLATFILYQSIAVFAVLNIVTGIFVESAMNYSHNDQETMIQDEITNKESTHAILGAIFQEMDNDGSGQVTLKELHAAVQDQRMEAYFAALGIRPHSLATLFHLLDADRMGALEISEFLDGCLKYKGQASGLELANIGVQVAGIVDCIQELSHKVGVNQRGLRRNSLSAGHCIGGGGCSHPVSVASA